MKIINRFMPTMNKSLIALTVYLLSFSALFSDYIVLNHPKWDRGMFSVFDYVFGNIYLYSHENKLRKKYQGFTVNFENKGLYYSKDEGDNWWNYYFEPIQLGKLSGNSFKIDSMLQNKPLLFLEFKLNKFQVKSLIDQFFKLKPEIEKAINSFSEQYFNDFYVIGVHYRGTDKSCEARRVEYGEMSDVITAKIETLSGSVRIFVATDEQQFLEYMISNFGDKVIFIEEALRSNDSKPIHMFNDDPYLSGYYAIIDTILLSKCDYLFRTSSNLSRWSTYFNPELPCTEMNQRQFIRKNKSL